MKVKLIEYYQEWAMPIIKGAYRSNTNKSFGIDLFISLALRFGKHQKMPCAL